MEPLSGELVTRCLNFHGQQLQKIWEAERGDQDLARHNIKDLDFLEYAQRQKHLSFQDRGKRLKLHQFVVKKCGMLFSPNVLDNIPQGEPQTTEDIYAIMPPFETFLTVDKQSRLRYFFEQIKIGDLLLGTIVSKTTAGMMLKVLCTTSSGSTVRYVADINVKAFCPMANIIPAVDRKGVSRSYMMNDSVCCEVLEVIPDTDKMVCGMKGSTRQPGDPEPRPTLGLITADDFPLEYKKALDNKGESYDAVLEKSVGFNNPNNISFLSKHMALGPDHCSLMTGLKGRFPEQEYSIELRQVQASKWAFRSVADGIDHFKAGRHTEAFQCLNKALTIDPKNVEGLVARGALYANSGNFQKAIEDFETALKLNPSHANARKYMGETLVALGRSYEDENKLEEARKAYQSCLTIIPFHEEAQNSLDFLKNKANAPKNLIEPGELLLPTLSSNKPYEVKENIMKQLMKTDEQEKKDKKKKKKSKKRKNRHHSSSSSSSSSSGSSRSSSSSSSSSTESSSGTSDSEFKKRKKRRHRREKQRSLSPLSKRMAMMDPSHETPSNYQFNKPNSSFQFGFEQQQLPPPSEPAKNNDDVEYELKVRTFLEQTKGDSDYEEKVRKFLDETTRWKKDKKSYDKKKKKKRDKKAKKESKRKRKEKKLRHKDFDLHDLEEQIENKKLREVLKKELGVKDKHKRRSVNMDVADYLLEKAGFLDSVPDLEDLESKLRDYYALEKECKRSDRSGSLSPKRSMLESPSPTREQKARQAVAEATASASACGVPTKWKMQIGAVQGGSRFKKRPEREDWIDESRRDAHDDKQKQPPPPPEEKGISVRKAMAMKEPIPSKKDQPPEPPKSKPKMQQLSKQPIITPGQVVLDKFGSFRLLSPSAKKMPDEDLPPLPPGAPPKSAYPGRGSKPPEPPGRPRSGSRSPKRKSRSRSRGKYSRPSSRSSSASRSRGRSRSRSYRSRSRSYYTRSRSRSGSRSYYSRSRSRSRSYSGDRRRVHDRRGGFRGRYNDRGTYYKPRFQAYKNSRGNYRGRGGYNRDGRDFNRDYRDYRGGRGRPFNYNNRGRRPRGRFRGNNYRDFRDRRYDRSRSRDNSRDRSVSRENDDTMKKVNEEKEKINKYLDNGDEPVRHEGPLSEGEDRDDYSSDKFVDRQSFDGKWAEKEAENGGGGGGGVGVGGGGGGETNPNPDMPPETNIEEMDKFLSKVKKEKKEEMLERNKEMLKTKPW